MKTLSLLLLTGLQLVAGLPQHDHGTTTAVPTTSTSTGHSHGTETSTHDHGGTTTIPSPTGTAPTGCKLTSADVGFPAPAAWSSALPGVTVLGMQGDVPRPDYRLAATSVAQVQAAVRFAAANNIRISILNSGHDFLGRNDSPSGLVVDISGLGGIKALTSFTPSASGASAPGAEPNVITPIAGRQAAVTFGAGISTQVLNDALDKSGLFTMGAAHGTVKTAGGYGQSAGHGPLTSKYGLAVDQVLEYKVVTADGSLKIANNVVNTDLFWALRGGGGGNFGVVVEATVKAYPSPKITVTNWWINATSATNPGQGFWDAAAYLHSQFPALNAKGVQGYYYVYPAAMKGIFLTADTQAGIPNAQAIWQPVLTRLQQFSGMRPAEAKYYDYASYKAYFDMRFGPICEEEEGGHDHKVKRHEGEMVEPMGITPMDSRLLGQAHLTSTSLAAALKAALPLVPDGQLRGHLIGGGKVLTPTEDTSVHPAWRKAYVHLIATGAGAFMADALRTLAPDMGAYSNEASTKNPNWKADFFGANYDKLSQIKTKYDPNGVFWVTPGVNADNFQVVNGRVCKATPSNASLAPANDNKNLVKRGGEGNEDTMSNFPGVGSGGDGHSHGSCGEEMEPHEPELPDGFVIEPRLDPSKPPVTPGTTLSKFRYGPYNLAAGGMLTNRPVLRVDKPCSNCWITAVGAGLEYADGTVANVNTGAWLHHMVLSVRGTGKRDLVCSSGIAALMGARWFASGNERAVMRINKDHKYGLNLASGDSMSMIVDLMNTSNESKNLYLTMTYEHMPKTGSAASGYREAKVAWLDITGCGASAVPAQKGVFELRSPGWRSTVSGPMLWSTGHVHDGGVATTIEQNGKEVCRSNQVYGRIAEYVPPADGGGGHSHASGHISDSGVCHNFGDVRSGDTLTVVAYYDTNKYPLDEHDGEAHDIMGISRVIIGSG